MDGPKYPEIEVELIGKDGNSFAIIGACQSAARRAGISEEEVEEFIAEATSGNRDHLIQTVMRWFTVC